VVNEDYVLRIPRNLALNAAARPDVRGNHIVFAAETLEGRSIHESGDRRFWPAPSEGLPLIFDNAAELWNQAQE
jgi:hypothetical protein